MKTSRTGLATLVVAVAAVTSPVLFTVGCSKQEPPPTEVAANTEKLVEIEGSRDVALSVKLNIARLVEEFEERAPESKKEDPEAAEALAWVKQMAVGTATLLLVHDEETTVAPVLMVQDPGQRIWSELSSNPRFEEYLAKRTDGTLEPKWESMPDSESIPEAQKQLLIRSIGERVVAARLEVLERLASGEWRPGQALLTKLSRQVESPDSLVTLGVLVPEEIKTDWREKLVEHEKVKANMAAKIVVGVVGELLDELRDLLKTTQAIAVSFTFTGEEGRGLSYAHLFDSPSTAEKAQTAVTEAVEGEDEIDEFLVGVMELLAHEGLQKGIRCSANLLRIELDWAQASDKEVKQLLAAATVGYVFSKSMGASMEPSEGPIEVAYTEKPVLQEAVEAGKLESRLEAQLRERIFPGWFFGIGDEPHMVLEMEPPDVPNASLAEADYEITAVKTTNRKDVRREEEKKFGSQLQLSATHATHIRVPVLKGTKGKSLGTATIKVKVTLPTALEIFEFKAGDEKGTEKKQNGIAVKLARLERDVAGVSVRGARKQRLSLYAFDAEGRALQRKEGMKSDRSASQRFRGLIHELWVAVPREVQELTPTIDVDLNGGKRLELFKKPSRKVRTRVESSPRKSYKSVDESQLEGLEVQWHEEADKQWQNGLFFRLPPGVSQAQTQWEVRWFAHDRPLLLKGQNGFSSDGRCSWHVRKGLEKATAVVGAAQLTVPTGIQSLVFTKDKDGAWLSQPMDSEEPAKARFFRNEVTWVAGKAKVLAAAAYDGAGRRLKEGRRGSGKEGEYRHYWGLPAKLELVVSHQTIQKRLPIEIVKRETNAERFAEYKAQLADQRAVSIALQQIQKAAQRRWGRCDGIAGFHYFHDKEGKPLALIPQEYAHACPEGAERFGYEVVPYAGYYFSCVPAKMKEGKPVPLRRQSAKKEFAWDEGKIQIEPYAEQAAIAAWPKDPSQPTFIQKAWGGPLLKYVEGKRVEAMPEDAQKEGWVEMSFMPQ